MLFSFLFFVKEKENIKIHIDMKTKIVVSITFILIVVLIYSSIYVQWNIVSNQIIYGVQGRYFLPVVLLTSLIFDNKYLIVKEKISRRYIFLFMLFIRASNRIFNKVIYIYK